MSFTFTVADSARFTQVARENFRTAIAAKEQWYACIGITDKALPNRKTVTFSLSGGGAPATFSALIDSISNAALQVFDENWNSGTGTATAFYCTMPTAYVDEANGVIKVYADWVAPTESEFRSGIWAPTP